MNRRTLCLVTYLGYGTSILFRIHHFANSADSDQSILCWTLNQFGTLCQVTYSINVFPIEKRHYFGQDISKLYFWGTHRILTPTLLYILIVRRLDSVG